jgi:hypothetical protein
MRGTCTEVPQKRHHLAIERGVVLAELGVSVYEWFKTDTAGIC